MRILQISEIVLFTQHCVALVGFGSRVMKLCEMKGFLPSSSRGIVSNIDLCSVELQVSDRNCEIGFCQF